MIDIQLPPPNWIAPPPLTMIELRLSLAQIETICRALGAANAEAQKDVFGCSVWGAGGCLIVVPKVEMGSTEQDQARVRKHEVAHCNGWRHESR